MYVIRVDRINYGASVRRVISANIECWNIRVWRNVCIILAIRLITAGDLLANKLTINVTQSRLENVKTVPRSRFRTRYLFHDRAHEYFFILFITPI